jgi:hypothetical protein
MLSFALAMDSARKEFKIVLEAVLVDSGACLVAMITRMECDNWREQQFNDSGLNAVVPRGAIR